MDFVTIFPEVIFGYDSLRLIMDILTKFAHFPLININVKPLNGLNMLDNLRFF